MTSRGLKEDDFRHIVSLVDRALMGANDESVLSSVRSDILDMCGAFPLYDNVLA
jgi:glycine hydroxymethyltransferase